MEADFQFNNFKVLFLSMSYHVENPLYLPMKLSFFPKNAFTKGNFSFYLLLNCDVDIDMSDAMLAHFTAI